MKPKNTYQNYILYKKIHYLYQLNNLFIKTKINKNNFKRKEIILYDKLIN